MTINEYLEVVAGAIGGMAALLAIAGWLGRTWLSNKFKSSIQHAYDVKLVEFKAELAAAERINHERWVMKRDVFLKALKLVDAWWANIEWVHQPQVQPRPTIEEIRDIHNQISLICENDNVLKSFKTCFRVSTGNESPPNLSMDAIVDLRNAMREELTFSTTFPDDRENSWFVAITMKD